MLLLLPLLLAPQATGTAETEPRLALLVGIDRYDAAPEDVPVLAGAVRDVERAAALLRGRFDFTDDQIVVLTDEDATHEAIVRAFHDHLITRASDTSEVVFWFAGHGSRATAASTSAPTWVAHDSRSMDQEDPRDVSSAELGGLLNALAERAAHALVILDTGHEPRAAGSARATRGIAPLEALPTPRAASWPEGIELARGLEADDDARTVICRATRWGQPAEEVVTEVEKDSRIATQGLLSYVLQDELATCSSLEAASPGGPRDLSSPENQERRADTLGDVLERVRVRIGSRLPGRGIGVEGNVARAFLDGNFPAPSPGLSATAIAPRLIEIDGVPVPRSEHGEFRLEGGGLAGLRPGSLFAVNDAAGRALLGLGDATFVGPAHAIASWRDAPQGVEPGEPLLAVEIARPSRRRPLAIRATDDGLRALVDTLRSATRVADVDAAAYRLEVVGETGEGDGRSLQLVDPHGVRAWPITDDVWDEERLGALDVRVRDELLPTLEAAFVRELRWRELFALPEERGELPLRLSVGPPTRPVRAGLDRSTAPPIVPFDDDASPASAIGQRRIRLGPGSGGFVGESLVSVQSTGERAVFVGVFVVSEDRTVTRVMPAEGESPLLLGKGSVRSKRVGFFIPERWQLDRPQRDRIVAVASVDPTDFAEVDLDAERDLARIGALPPPLARALLAGEPEAQLVTTSPDGWGTTSLDVILVGDPTLDPRRFR